MYLVMDTVVCELNIAFRFSKIFIAFKKLVTGIRNKTGQTSSFEWFQKRIIIN